jgi:glycosyltransferase involved in cell wall biosynthesis
MFVSSAARGSSQLGIIESHLPYSSSEASRGKCRLLYLVGQLAMGGSERQLYYLLKSMDREQYNPVVVVFNYNDADPYGNRIRGLGVPLYFWPNTRSSLFKLRDFRKIVIQLRPEVVHSYSFFTNFVVWWATLGSQSIPIGSIRKDFISERIQIKGRINARWPRNQICNSLAAQKTVENCGGLFKPARVFMVRNGLDLDLFHSNPSLPRRPVLLAIGRHFPEKRWDRLLQILSLVAAKNLQFTVNQVGDGPLRKALEAQAKDLGLENRINFLGLQDDIPRLLADSSFLIHTADDEGTPNVVMEAMACGRAVVATDAGDIPFLVDDGKTGFVVPRLDNGAFVDRISRLLTNSELCCHMGEAGRIKAELEFRLDRLVTQTFEVYQLEGWRPSSFEKKSRI